MSHTKRGLSVIASFALLALSSCSVGRSETAIVEITDATIEWSACEGEDAPDEPFECASIEVPLDYSELDLATIEIALVRIPADKEFDYRGILLTNPGGPGGSGFDFLVSAGEELQNEVGLYNFDLVGFDPRGVDRSGGLRCATDEELDRFSYLDYTPDNAKERKALDDYESDDSTCESRIGPSIVHYSTANTARDMDKIREGMGVESINFLGISYGTYLGGVYATLFPDRVSAMVLDGGYDPQGDTIEQEYATQARGFEDAFSNWIEWCESDELCDFRSDDVRKGWDDLYNQLDKKSLVSSEGRDVNHQALMTATISSLYSPSAWEYLGSAIALAKDGYPDFLLYMADLFNDRNEDGVYTTSQSSSYIIRCASGFEKELPSEPVAFVKGLKDESPWFYRELEASDFDEPSCESVFEGKDLVTVSYSGDAPIVVVGGVNDPATPFRWSEELKSNMGSNSALVRFTGEGHGQILDSKCVGAIAEAAFVENEIPKSLKTCNPDEKVKRPTWWSNIPQTAKLGMMLDSDALNEAIELKDTDAYSEFRSVKEDAESVFKKINDAFKIAGYEVSCDGETPPFYDPCFFSKGELDEFGFVLYSSDELDEYELSEPRGPVPADSTLIVFYYWP